MLGSAKLRPDAVPSLHLPTASYVDADTDKVVRTTKCGVTGCRPEPKAKRHPVPNKTHGGKRDPRRDYWLLLCGVDLDDKRADLRVCGKHFDKDRDYNPKTGRLLSSANPSLYLPGDTEGEEEELPQLDELMETDDEEDQAY